ncbi:MAG: FAD-dependent oxidoreductase, partial [Pedococcus sp.]
MPSASPPTAGSAPAGGSAGTLGGPAAHALADTAPSVFWLDRPDRPATRPSLDADASADLVVVGGGYTGLWTALLAKEANPRRDVLLVEAARIGWAASGRNGGFCSASLTHGEANGRERWPAEYEQLHRLGLANLDAIQDTVQRHGIDCDFRRTGELTVATAPHQVDWLREDLGSGTFLDRDAIRAELDSPTYLAGVHTPDETAMVDPARLAWGLAA